MPNYRRADVEGGTYFFTVTTYRRLPLLTEESVRAALHEAIGKVRSTLPFVVRAWVLLPDHLHCVWTLPTGDAAFPKRWGMIKRAVSMQCARQLRLPPTESRSGQRRHEATFWQRRYWEHLIRDEADYQRHIDYIHWNPVKHGLVKRAIDWPYSTFRRYVRNGVYAADWGLMELSDGDYGE